MYMTTLIKSKNSFMLKHETINTCRRYWKSHTLQTSALNGREWPLYSKGNKLQYPLHCRLEGS
jgi:hypothetical protein